MRPPVLAERAPAKVNLTLKVLGRRADGYHELTSLVAFAGVGDELSLEPGPELSLTVGGPEGAALAAEADNLVLKAARLLAQRVRGLAAGRFHLVKRLPLASGVGGGSSDAAAALRLLARLNRLSADDPRLHEAAGLAGADVPVCMARRARLMAGLGERLGPPIRLPRLFAVLVNPRVPAATPAVFAGLGLAPGQFLGHAAAAGPSVSSWMAEWPEDADAFAQSVLAEQGNDLEAPAMRVAPEIATVLDALRRAPGCLLARMSGSGATCFGIFADCAASARGARLLSRAHPGWWVKPTVLR